MGESSSRALPVLSVLTWFPHWWGRILKSFASWNLERKLPSSAPRRSLADICTARGLSEALTGAKAVVHLAARNHVLSETEKDPLLEYRRVNVEGTRNVVRAARNQGVGLFVHLSSIKAMGEGTGDILDETSPCLPSTPYGISKLESEEVVRAETDGTGMAVLIFRLPMVYGPGNKGNLPRMIRWADRGLPFPLVQPDNLRSMVYVGNVMAAVKAVLEAHRSRMARRQGPISSRMMRIIRRA